MTSTEPIIEKVLVQYPADLAAPFQFSVALANLASSFCSRGLTLKECASVMEFHQKLINTSPL